MKEIRGNNFVGRIINEHDSFGNASLIKFEGELFSEDGELDLHDKHALSKFDDRFNGMIVLRERQQIANGFVYSFSASGQILFRGVSLDKLPGRCVLCGQEMHE